MNQISSIGGADPVSTQRPRLVAVADIQAVVCAHYGLSRAELTGGDRNRHYAWPRQMAMKLARKLTKMSLPEIGRRFGGRDHTTVIYACKAVRTRCEHSPDQRADLDAFMAIFAPVTRAEFFRRDTIYGRFVSVRRSLSQ